MRKNRRRLCAFFMAYVMCAVAVYTGGMAAWAATDIDALSNVQAEVMTGETEVDNAAKAEAGKVQPVAELKQYTDGADSDIELEEVLTEADGAVDINILINDNWEDVEEADTEAETDNQFQLKRLVLLADVLEDTYGAVEILHYEKYQEYVLQFATEADTEYAYYQLLEEYGDEACFADEVIWADDLQAIDEIEPADCLSWGADYMGLSYLKAEYDYYQIEQPVTVAIIDSGVDAAHTVFQNRIDTAGSSYIYVNNGAVLSDQEYVDGYGHGTHVAGIIADTTPENVTLMILRTFDSNGQSHDLATGKSTTLAIATAMQYAIDADVDVINMSLGWNGESAALYNFLDAIIDEAYDNNIPIVCAAGNKSTDVIYSYPANNKKVITVSAINSSDTFASSYSNYGEMIDYCAPGTSVKSAYIGGTEASLSGTSMSAPHVTAAIAYLKMAEPELTMTEIEETLRQYAVDLGPVGWDEQFGYGYLNLYTYFDDLNLPLWEDVATDSDAERLEPEVGFTFSEVNMEYADTYVDNSFLTNSTGAVTYRTDNPAVATVDNNGRVHIEGAGSCKITATVAANATYKSASASYQLMIDRKDISGMTAYIDSGNTQYAYTGYAWKPTIKVTGLTEDAYTVSYSNNIDLGTATATVKGVGNYTGSSNVSFSIVLGTVVLGTAENQSSGVLLNWYPVAGATGYRIYRKMDGGSWKLLGSVESAGNVSTESFLDTTAASRIKYIYTVRATTANKIGGYDMNGRSIIRLNQPAVAVDNKNSGVYVRWTNVPGAEAYRIYRKTNGGGWVHIKTVSSGVLGWGDTNVVAGNSYTYTVRACSANCISSYYSGKTTYWMPGGTITSLTRDTSGQITVKWNEMSMAEGYQVQYATNSSFTDAKHYTITGYHNTQKTITGLNSNTTYYIRVRTYRRVGGILYCSEWGAVKKK